MHHSEWKEEMIQMCTPVLDHFLDETLEDFVGNNSNAIVEAVVRTLIGFTPWLELEEDEEEKEIYRKTVKNVMEGIAEGKVNFNFHDNKQKLVEAGLLSYVIMSSPNTTFNCLDGNHKEMLIEKICESRIFVPHLNNWLLFSAVRESMCHKMGYNYNKYHIENAGIAFNDWYVGDGFFKDGIYYAHDFYNSIIIQPLLSTICDEIEFKQNFNHDIENIFIRHTVHLERKISCSGEYPLNGRSLSYRYGVFHHLAKMAQLNLLDSNLSRSGVKNALSAIIRNYRTNGDIYESNGFLKLGLLKDQNSVVERYINRGSLYMASSIFIVLGIKKDDDFWIGNDEWSAKKLWSGKEAFLDKKIH